MAENSLAGPSGQLLMEPNSWDAEVNQMIAQVDRSLRENEIDDLDSATSGLNVNRHAYRIIEIEIATRRNVMDK